jgi:predicted restriction endonuclease
LFSVSPAGFHNPHVFVVSIILDIKRDIHRYRDVVKNHMVDCRLRDELIVKPKEVGHK